MRTVNCALIVFAMMAAAPLRAQKWEFGGIAGGSFYQSKDVTGANGSASAGFATGWAAGVIIGHGKYKHFGGEIRYEMQRNDMELESGSTKATFAGQSHALHYDVVLHMTPRGSRVRPFVAVGGGGKLYRGTGKEIRFQPLSNVALLTKTREWTGLVTAAAGIKFHVSDHILFRAEIRDFITPFPKKVIAPTEKSNIDGWIHNLTPLFGITVIF